jgi:hypothetical protein
MHGSNPVSAAYRLAFASASMLRVNPQQHAYNAKEPAGSLRLNMMCCNRDFD